MSESQPIGQLIDSLGVTSTSAPDDLPVDRSRMLDQVHEPIPHDGSHITTAQARHIEAYMCEILSALNLGQWRIGVAVDLPPEGASLMISPVDGRRYATLYIAADWWQRDADEKRLDITHEALHLAHHDADATIRQWLNGSGDIADYVKSILVDRFKTDLERMVDALSYALAPHMPAWTDPEDTE